MIMNKTKNAAEARHYDGFIGQDGTFYKVSEIYKHSPSHYDWAENFLRDMMKKTDDKKMSQKILEDIVLCGGHQNYLLKKMGFIYYGHSQRPDRHPIIEGKKNIFKRIIITEEQKRILFEIMDLNNELDSYPFDDYNDEYSKIK